MTTKHYKIINSNNYPQQETKIENLKKYFADIEKVFPYIEGVFGSDWNDGLIEVELSDRTNYSRPNSVHLIKIKLHDGIIQRKKYPENLWGCLLHETLHAFVNPIIYRSTGKYDLNCGYCKEPFIKSFQSMVYFRLKEKGEINKELYKKFLHDLGHNLCSDSSKVYEYYRKIFLKSSDNFSKFIKKLNSSNVILIRNNTFWQNLEVIEKSLN